MSYAATRVGGIGRKRTDGSTVCWGDSSSGQLMPPAVALSQISAGSSRTSGLSSSGEVWEWGAWARQPL